jgi:hypothetical protein
MHTLFSSFEALDLFLRRTKTLPGARICSDPSSSFSPLAMKAVRCTSDTKVKNGPLILRPSPLLKKTLQLRILRSIATLNMKSLWSTPVTVLH